MIHLEILENRTPADVAAPEASPASQALLHSAAGRDARWSRWSFLPGPAVMRLRCDGGRTVLRDASRVRRQWDHPVAALAWLGEQMIERPSDDPPFKGGWIGWLSYDLGRWFETLPARAADDLRLPLFEFTFHPGGLACDHLENRVFRFWNDRHAHDRVIEPPAQQPGGRREFISNFDRADYERAVAAAIEYIRAGDVFQVNLAQRFTGAAPLAPAEIYLRLCSRSPAWLGAYYASDDYTLVCNSPELFLRVTPDLENGRRQVITRPIKGTRKRAAEMESELRDSRKDQAELNMIVDLERNDLGRVCEIGSVKVTEPRVIEAHPTVYHGAATIEGTLRQDIGFVDLLRATFPGGSITGAPKIRAMQIIDELEPVRRGPYCGAIGYLSLDGHVQFNIAIRTMIIKEDQIHIPVGGGIVADSHPAAEYEETLVKAAAMFDALRD